MACSFLTVFNDCISFKAVLKNIKLLKVKGAMGDFVNSFFF